MDLDDKFWHRVWGDQLVFFKLLDPNVLDLKNFHHNPKDWFNAAS